LIGPLCLALTVANRSGTAGVGDLLAISATKFMPPPSRQHFDLSQSHAVLPHLSNLALGDEPGDAWSSRPKRDIGRTCRDGGLWPVADEGMERRIQAARPRANAETKPTFL